MKILQRIQFPDIWDNLGVDVDLPNGLLIGAAMMKTTTLIATGMVVLVVTMTLVGGTLSAL